MKKWIIGSILCIGLSLGASSLGYAYQDVPQTHWAHTYIEKAATLGLVYGKTETDFGLGQELTRAEFVSMLVRMMEWEKISTSSVSFSDCEAGAWYLTDLKTAVAHGVVPEGGPFRPQASITREEMAVMLINALGYHYLAESMESASVPFTDVHTNKGAICVAYELGLVSGKTNTMFSPSGTALREEAASTLVRTQEKRHSPTSWLHGFYAFSSYSQKDLALAMDAVSFGWSRLQYQNGVQLLTNGTNQNEWKIPDAYEQIVAELSKNSVEMYLNVFMSENEAAILPGGSTVGLCTAILTTPENRKAAIDAIVAEITKQYPGSKESFYTGVTLDFENMKGESLKAGLNAFLEELSQRLTSIGKKLNVAVHPVIKGSSYYDAYDFQTISRFANKIILMAHDYQAETMDENGMRIGFTVTPVTPFDQIYYALLAIKQAIGEEQVSKIVLAFSINQAGWNVLDGHVTNQQALKPTYSEISEHIRSGAENQYSQQYKNPYITYADGSGGETTVWYESEQSIHDKLTLAKLLGIQNFSIWRVGTIPTDSATGLNIWNALKK